MNKLVYDGVFEEGDVIGFFGELYEKSYIEKLMYFNVFRVKMVGVISRLVYLEVKIFVEDEVKGKFEDVIEKICLCKLMFDNNDYILCFLVCEDN